MSDLSKGLDWFLDNQGIIETVVNVISPTVSTRDLIPGTPQEGYPEGQDEAHTNNIVERSADVTTRTQDFFDQVKGLFGLGYPASEPQPTSPVSHEVTPADLPAPAGSSILTGISVGTIAMIAIALLLLFKK